jgi:hypothetical protein
MAFSNQIDLPESQFKNFLHILAYDKLVSLVPGRCKLGCWFHQNHLLRFRPVLSRDLANLGKSSSGIWPFSASRLLGLCRFLN